MMQSVLNELPQLIVTLALLVMVTVLLIFGIIPKDDVLVGTVFTGVLSYWFLNGAFKFNPNNTASAPAPTQPTLPPAA